MLSRLPLRLRMLLIFGGLAGAILAALGLGLGVAATRMLAAGAGRELLLDPLIQAATIAGLVTLGLIAGVWFLFDRNLARPIETLAGGLRTGRAPAPEEARYLADLGPAARDAAEARARSAEALAEAIGEHAAELSREKATLESILADFGAGAVMTDAPGRVVFYNASAARLLPGLGLDRRLDRHLLPGALEAAAARLETGAEATDLVCLSAEGLRLAGRMRRIDGGTLLILRDAAPEAPAPRAALESLRRHAATLVPMLEALDGPIPPALARAIRDEGQGLAQATRALSQIMAEEAPPDRATLTELGAGLVPAAPLPPLAVLAEAGAVNALLRRLALRLDESGRQPRLAIGLDEASEAHLHLCWDGPPVPMDLLDGWLAEAPDAGQPDLSGADILTRHGTGIWPEDQGGQPRLVLPLRLAPGQAAGQAGGVANGGGLTYDFALATRGAASSRLADLTCVVFDTETTGLSITEDRIVQIAGVRIARGRLTGERFETLVRPGRPIPPGATAIHHITDEMVADAPGMTAALTAFHHFAEGAVLIAHNAPFDMGLLREAAFETGARFDNRVLDTVLLSAMVWGMTAVHSLDALTERLGIEIPADQRHTAMGDTIATAEAFLRLIPALEGKGISRFEEAVAEGRRYRRLIEDANDPALLGLDITAGQGGG